MYISPDNIQCPNNKLCFSHDPCDYLVSSLICGSSYVTFTNFVLTHGYLKLEAIPAE